MGRFLHVKLIAGSGESGRSWAWVVTGGEDDPVRWWRWAN